MRPEADRQGSRWPGRLPRETSHRLSRLDPRSSAAEATTRSPRWGLTSRSRSPKSVRWAHPAPNPGLASPDSRQALMCYRQSAMRRQRRRRHTKMRRPCNEGVWQPAHLRLHWQGQAHPSRFSRPRARRQTGTIPKAQHLWPTSTLYVASHQGSVVGGATPGVRAPHRFVRSIRSPSTGASA